MKMDSQDFSVFSVVIAVLSCVGIGAAGIVGHQAWSASEKAAAYKAYVECLRETKHQTIDVQQSFCGRIRDQL